MRVFQTNWFERWASKQGLSAEALIIAVDEIEQGLVDANLGGQVFKKRVAVAGRGKRSSTRTLLAIKSKDRAFYLYGFAKNQRDNISDIELSALKKLAAHLLAYDSKALDKAIAAQEIGELTRGQA